MSLLWSTYSNARIFDWKDLLEEWHDSLHMPLHIQTLIDNLKEASDPNSDFDPPLSQFLNYLNHEEAGLAWFLYELVTHRWMWSSIRLDFVRDLVDEIENLDGCFPRFPGSPWTSKTIRQWLTENLSADELDEVQMMPPLETPPAYTSYSYQTPQRAARMSHMYEAPPAPARLSRSYATGGVAAPKPRHGSMIFYLQREGEGEATDDKIYVSKDDTYDSYTISYTDGQSKVKFVSCGLSGTKVVESVRKILRMLTIDEKPFEYLQVSLPSMPTILVKPENLTSQTRDLIYDSIETTMDDWPVLV
jgi:hypothetical protein